MIERVKPVNPIDRKHIGLQKNNIRYLICQFHQENLFIAEI